MHPKKPNNTQNSAPLRRPNPSNFKQQKNMRPDPSQTGRTFFKRNLSGEELINAPKAEDAEYKKTEMLKHLNGQMPLVQQIFQAVFEVKKAQAEALKVYQEAQGELLSARMECDQTVREFKKRSTAQIMALQATFSRIKSETEQEIIAIRGKIDL